MLIVMASQYIRKKKVNQITHKQAWALLNKKVRKAWT